MSPGTLPLVEAGVTVVDTMAPAVTPRPGPSQLQCHSDAWTDPGATALDQCVGDLSAGVQVTGLVDPNHIGSYSETYSATDPSGNVGLATRTVNVVDTLPPVLTLNPEVASLQCGIDAYVEAGAKATDVCAGDLTTKISENSAVKPNVVGQYNVTYSVADPSGNSASLIRAVGVVDTIAPSTSVTVGPSPAVNKYVTINITSYSVTPKGGGTPVTGSATCWTSPGVAASR